MWRKELGREKDQMGKGEGWQGKEKQACVTNKGAKSTLEDKPLLQTTCQIACHLGNLAPPIIYQQP